jgi:hypothetical protein
MKKKVIRLTESQLVELIGNIIEEQTQQQDQTMFEVYFLAGNVSKQSKKGKEVLKIGSTISGSDSITLSSGSKVYLMHPFTNKTLELRKPGTYTIPNLIKSLPDKNVVRDYAKFAFSTEDPQQINKLRASAVVRR